MKRILAMIPFLLSGTSLADHELDNRDIEGGSFLYEQHCASCHGAQLEGQENWRLPDENGIYPAPPHDLTGHTWHHDNQLLFDYTKLGGLGLMESRGIADFPSNMPGFGDVMTDDEIWNILAYIRSTWPERIKHIQSARNPRHEQ